MTNGYCKGHDMDSVKGMIRNNKLKVSKETTHYSYQNEKDKAVSYIGHVSLHHRLIW